MKMAIHGNVLVDPKRKRTFPCCHVSAIFLFSAAFLIASAFVVTEYRERFLELHFVDHLPNTRPKACEAECRPQGAEALPKGIAKITSDLEMRPLWGHHTKKMSTYLLAMAVGIKQKESVNKIVQKFLPHNFVVMLFHYDGILDEWRDLEWCGLAIHVSAVKQTKWWFAKRFLHPDIVYEYEYIFLWDEDLGVENFHVEKYLSIIKKEGLEISQPALDPEVSEVHHDFTARESKLQVHRKINKMISGRRKCDDNSTAPPCTGFVEMMAPVFSKASWRCVWHMIQNDLVHAWGLDFQLGYCAQGDRTKNIGIVDAEYIAHYGLPTLGGSSPNKTSAGTPIDQNKTLSNEEVVASPSNQTDARTEVRKQSYVELEIFKNRWKRAVKDDGCWNDPFQQPPQESKSQ
ncbi:hypothetical protein L6164_000305 [Bauhinia variegata]|uniref:Uncharacterized protein n=1 Tax=Bauhinia variegata TaxID=167791 RepID=A0ACB9Q635_BAUVA|nr:hypothetical protein L6164_000305 [Bauhinia variegata]